MEERGTSQRILRHYHRDYSSAKIISQGRHKVALRCTGVHLFIYSFILFSVSFKAIYPHSAIQCFLNFKYPLVFLRTSSKCLRLIPRLLVTYILYLSFNNVFQEAVPMPDVTNPVVSSRFLKDIQYLLTSYSSSSRHLYPFLCLQ